MKTANPKSLSRFIDAQRDTYETALGEIRAGRKNSHWMWFIFPQLMGLGSSPMAEFYGVEDLAEARAFLAEAVLRERLLEISAALLQLDGGDPVAILGYPDNLKLKSSMTLLSLANPGCPVFGAVLDKFYGGEMDAATVKLAGG